MYIYYGYLSHTHITPQGGLYLEGHHPHTLSPCICVGPYIIDMSVGADSYLQQYRTSGCMCVGICEWSMLFPETSEHSIETIHWNSYHFNCMQYTHLQGINMQPFTIACQYNYIYTWYLAVVFVNQAAIICLLYTLYWFSSVQIPCIRFPASGDVNLVTTTTPVYACLSGNQWLQSTKDVSPITCNSRFLCMSMYAKKIEDYDSPIQQLHINI